MIPSAADHWFLAGFVGMALGSAILLVLAFQAREEDRDHAAVAFIVPLVATASYFALFTERLNFVVGGQVTEAPRYIDWVVTTPLLLASLVLLALPNRGPGEGRGPRFTSLLLTLGFFDAYMILTGLFAGLSGTTGPKWTWYALSSGAFLAVLYLLWGPLLAEARSRGGHPATPRVRAYRILAGYLSVIWFIYPIVWALGPLGAKAWGITLDAAIFTILDLVAKVVFGITSILVERRLSNIEEGAPVQPAPSPVA